MTFHDPSTLTVHWDAENDAGGTATPNDFELSVEGDPIGQAEMVPLGSGTFMVVIDQAPAGYTATFSGDCVGGEVTLGTDEDLICEVTFHDPNPCGIPGPIAPDGSFSGQETTLDCVADELQDFAEERGCDGGSIWAFVTRPSGDVWFSRHFNIGWRRGLLVSLSTLPEVIPADAILTLSCWHL